MTLTETIASPNARQMNKSSGTRKNSASRIACALLIIRRPANTSFARAVSSGLETARPAGLHPHRLGRHQRRTNYRRDRRSGPHHHSGSNPRPRLAGNHPALPLIRRDDAAGMRLGRAATLQVRLFRRRCFTKCHEGIFAELRSNRDRSRSEIIVRSRFEQNATTGLS